MPFIRNVATNVVLVAASTLAVLATKAVWDAGLGTIVEEQAAKLFVNKK